VELPRGAIVKLRLLSGVAIIALLVGKPATVSAQSYTWSGYYIGLNAGGVWGTSNASTKTDCTLFSPPGFFCDRFSGAANGPAVEASGSGKSTSNRFTGGVQAGANWQIGQLVYGIEADFGAFNLNGSRQVRSAYVTFSGAVGAGTIYNIGSTFDTDWLMTARGRIGWATPANMMLYVTGGLAVTELAVSNSFSDATGPSPGSESARASSTRVGWALGAGVEWAVAKNWAVKLEYLHVDLGKVTASGLITAAGGYAQALSTSRDLTAEVARLGVNYRF
jgi:outer membrane immunogenic protein